MTPLLQAWRALLHRRTFTLTAIVTLASGIAVTTTMFSIVEGVLLRPLPYPGAGQLVTLAEASPSQNNRVSLIAPVRLDDWNRMNGTFEAISGSYTENVTDTSGAEPERLDGRRVMPRYFDVFGMRPLVGRTFTTDEDRFGGSTAVVISEGFWTRRFGGRPDAIGSRLTIGGRGYSIVGVMPRAFTPAAIDAWIPAQLAPNVLTIRQARFLVGIGRMKPGITLADARRDLSRVQARLGQQYPATDKGWSADIKDLKEVRVGDYRRPLLLVLGAVALLFAIAVANVAGLVLVQLHRRSTELAIRAAIGASRAQIVGAMMREMAIIAAIGAGVGAALSRWLMRLSAVLFTSVPRLAESGVDRWALACAALLSVGAAALFGLLPAAYVTRTRIAGRLSSGGRAVSGSSHRLQGLLVISQLALGVLLAGTAGLLVRSYGSLTAVPIGFDPEHVVTFHVGAAWDEDRARVGQLQEGVVAALAELPGVRAAGFTNFLPATGATLRYQIHVDGLTGPEPGGMVTVGERTISHGYLEALAVPLAAGEWCPALRSGAAAPRAALVNRRFVGTFAGGQSIIGRGFSFSQDNTTSWRIVGMVGDVLEDGQAMPAAPYVYVCMQAGSWPDPEYVVRASGDPRPLLPAVRALVKSIDPSRPVFGATALSELIDAGLDQPRLNGRMLTTFAAAALLLAAIGLYGLMMLLVTERRRELGVRMALGATPSDLVGLVITGAGRLMAGGIGAGVLLTLGAGYLLRSLLFGVAPYDLPALAVSVAALALVSAAAIAIPAREASRVSPLEAMRVE